MPVNDLSSALREPTSAGAHLSGGRPPEFRLRFARHGLFGLLLIAVAWPLSWLLPGLRSHYLFFPLWLGYILLVDALVARRRAGSLLTDSPKRFILLFVVSAPAWWLFEALNLRLGNWVYLGREEFTHLEYFLLASLSFSTVIPAVFETADLLRTLRWVDRFRAGPRLPTSRITLVTWFLAGLAMLALLVALPRYFFPLTWLSLLFLFEPIAWKLGRPCLLRFWSRGDWRPAVSLAVGALICGFFWELWNFRSYPKWIYEIPYFDFVHIFEMPALGYLGYLPFGLELYPLAHLLMPHRPRKKYRYNRPESPSEQNESWI